MTSEKKTIRLSHPSFGKDILARIESILKTGRLTKGPVRETFEKALAANCNVAHAVTFNSGTSALMAALKTNNIGPGDKVVVPDYTFAATVNVVELAGGTPVFADVDRDDFGLSPSSLAKMDDDDIKMVIAVDQFGLPAKMDEIAKWARERGAVLVEDAACAIGSNYKGTPCGSIFGTGVFSFHPRKIITTGEGGALLTDDPDIARASRAFSDHGLINGAIKQEPGANLRLPEISCALGLEQLERLNETMMRANEIGQYFNERLKDRNDLILPNIPPDCFWNHQTYAIITTDKKKRDETIEKLLGSGIESNVPASSVSAMPYYLSKYNISAQAVAISRMLTERALSLPCHAGLSNEDIHRIVDALG